MADTPRTKDRQRSPHCPSISLGDAVRKIELFYKADRGNPASQASLAEHWELSPKSSVLKQAIASLKRYGLIENAPGSTKLLKLTPRALEIVMLDEHDSKRIAAIKSAALTPNIFRTLWDQWGLEMPSDRTAQHHLVTEMGFTVSTAADAIRYFKATISFANLESGDKIAGASSEDFDDDDDDDGGSLPAVRIGDLVQWESQGAIHFAAPRRVQGLSEQGDYVFVEGSSTGLPIGEIKVVQSSPNVAMTPPINPNYCQPANHTSTTFPLSHGTVRLEWPTEITADDLQDLKDWLVVAQRKIARSVQTDDE